MLISICVPTHQGRKEVVRGAVESVLLQITPDLRDRVEICVSDNASHDGTEEVMAGFGSAVRYHRNAANLGFPRNLQCLVDMATGEYCCLLGSDDQLEAGTLRALVELVERHRGVTGITVKRTNYDRTLTTRVQQDRANLLPADPQREHRYDSSEEIFENLALMHTYISANLFRRDRWLEVVHEAGIDQIDRRFAYYPHLYVWGVMCMRWPHWVWSPAPVIRYRTGNDASVETLNNDWIAHIKKTMSGLADVWGALLGSRSPTYRALMGKYAEFSWNPLSVRFCKAQPGCTLRGEADLLATHVRHLHFLPGFWASTFPSLIIPGAVYRTATRVGVGRAVRAARRLLRGESSPA